MVHTPQPPVLCTGFEGSVAASARHLFHLADESDVTAKGCLAGAPMLTAEDESTKVPGVFLVGPSVRHGDLSFLPRRTLTLTLTRTLTLTLTRTQVSSPFVPSNP